MAQARFSIREAVAEGFAFWRAHWRKAVGALAVAAVASSFAATGQPALVVVGAAVLIITGLLAPPADDIAEQGSSPERQTLIDALIRHRWKPTATAQALGISRATLYRRVHQHGIEMPGRSPA